MAPSAVETAPVEQPPSVNKVVAKDDYKQIGSRYQNYLPTWDPEEKYPPLQPFEHTDPGLQADPNFPALLGEGVQISHLTPSIGSEVRGIQISTLTDAGKSQLARLVAERKVVAFRDQDFAQLPIPDALKFGEFFGRHHIHPASGAPQGHPEIHLSVSSVGWHSDVSYEEQPPGTTFLYSLDLPSTGGDTLFANAVEAYNRLSPLFQERLHGLKAVHSAVEQAQASVNRGGVLRREPVLNEHPIVRTHPTNREIAVTRYIVGLKKEESEAILKFLYDHLWEKDTVVVWDNRVTQHSGLADWKTGERRHLARITPQAERPFETPFKA
ncbi:hypothetical protein NLU13_6309 [Sarocladium strictum]|uniref:TauD/TfdA-like domain-containing protein n=1 Tax=Sarocladium strictum TaxID=5046 RepID=A0AA39GGD6_SARSR|nr:hypothetical protein NLU13_6309 [Sarocladium strictum]